MADYKNDSTKRLMRTILSFSSEKDLTDFFDDLCTIKEIQDMAQRLDTAILLDKGESYQKISESVKVSTATISRVNRCLNYGNGGYKKALKFNKDE